MSPRKDPRINVRFPTMREMDLVELTANRDGLDLQNWIRQLVRDEIDERPLRRLMMRVAFESLLIIRAALESLIGPAETEKAKARAQAYIDELEKSARDQ